MKLFTVLALSLTAFAAQEPNQVRSNDSDALVSATGVTPLTHTATLAIMENSTLNLEPGIQMTRTQDGFSLSTFDGHHVALSTGSDTLVLASPVIARVTNAGWDFGNGKTYSSGAVTARRKQDDDADTNLKSMQESAKKLKGQPRLAQPSTRKLRVRWLYGENPMVTCELFSSEAILELSHISANGF